MTPAAVLDFWFSADPLPVQMRRWFGADPVFDSACRTVCAEALRDQDRAVALLSPLKLADVAEYAQRHRDVIRRYGRFPHRNAALGRTSTAAELAYLATPGAGF